MIITNFCYLFCPVKVSCYLNDVILRIFPNCGRELNASVEIFLQNAVQCNHRTRDKGLIGNASACRLSHEMSTLTFIYFLNSGGNRLLFLSSLKSARNWDFLWNHSKIQVFSGEI